MGKGEHILHAQNASEHFLLGYPSAKQADDQSLKAADSSLGLQTLCTKNQILCQQIPEKKYTTNAFEKVFLKLDNKCIKLYQGNHIFRETIMK